MKAAVLEGIERLTFKDVPTPELSTGSIIIKVKACSVCSTDLRTYHFGRGLKYPHDIRP